MALFARSEMAMLACGKGIQKAKIRKNVKTLSGYLARASPYALDFQLPSVWGEWASPKPSLGI